MKILSIETSCDETAISLLDISGPVEKPDIKILGNSLMSQAELHKEFGGVYPQLAKREHIKNLPILLEKTLKEAGEDKEVPDIDAIAVTSGPGLEPALWTGIDFAKTLGEKWGKPVVGVNHMEGHIVSPLFDTKEPIGFPALALLVSGGHTELVYIESFGKYKIIGRTKDDAVGEAFDKVARLLDLPYPGGPKISVLAEIHRSKGIEPSFSFPRPMIQSKDLNFSFSGLKTSVLYKLKTLGEITEDVREEVARAFEDAAIDVLVSKTKTALEEYEVQSLIVAGGVSLNNHLREEIMKISDEYSKVKFLFPGSGLTGDNALMIGLALYIRASIDPKILWSPQNIIAEGNLSLEA